MQEKTTPKVFISYSWSSEGTVMPLAERLVSHGIDVVLDKWDLKEGQDKYAFMERCVTDSTVTKVLIVCDKVYADKANSRTGGVGDETVIISGEIYGKMKQEKFIPIIVELDEDGHPYLPAYIQSRIYINLADEEKYEEEYEKLVRNIYAKPLYRKPKLGNRPEWLDEENRNFFPLIDLIRQINGANSEKKKSSCVNRFLVEYIETLKSYNEEKGMDGEQVYHCFLEMKTIRDIFLDFLSSLAETELNFSDVIGDAFEKMYNTLTNESNFYADGRSCGFSDFEIYKIHIWELFICVITFLRHRQQYKEIHALLTRTYFLSLQSFDRRIIPTNYCQFRFYSQQVEEEYKPTTEHKTKFTLLGDTIYNLREKRPIYTGKAMAEADLFLYQVRNAYSLTISKERYSISYWFPDLYVYVRSPLNEWVRIKSKRYCEKMFDLFGVKTIEDLKNAISNCKVEPNMGYNTGFNYAPAILSCVNLDDIGSVN